MGEVSEKSSFTTTVPKIKSDFENIRIIPECIIFDDPFEGKYFESVVVLQNIGPTPKFIRILEPTSSNIIMKAAKEGIFLAPGMKIKRKIKYTVVMATLVKSFVIPIYVNNQFIPYHCEVRLGQAIFELIPPIVNFGLIDAGPITSKQKIDIRNNGLKPSRFSIDLGLNELNVQVDPMKGILMQNSSITLTVEVNISDEGDHETEFWVIADTPICVKVYVSVIKGIIECIHKNAMNSFTFIRFPQIYYGTKSMKSAILKNRSQLPSLFCITGESNSKAMHFSDIIHIKNDYQHFNVSPLGGRLPSNDKRPFIFTFEPKCDKQNKRYLLILITIHKVLCSDIGMFNNTGLVTNKHEVKKYIIDLVKKECIHPYSSMRLKALIINAIGSQTNNGKYALFNFEWVFVLVFISNKIFRLNEESDAKDIYTGSISSVTSDGFILSSDFLDDEKNDDDLFGPGDEISNQIKVILYGETEQSSVSILPDALYLNDPIVGETLTRTLILTNNSKHLPIYYKYVKVTFIEIIPKAGYLRASESTEVLVKITPESCTTIDEFIKFELLYHDIPRIDPTLKVIGGKQIPVAFQAVFPFKPKIRDFVTANTFSFHKPNIKPNKEILMLLQYESAILALPNDRPCSLKPWKNSRSCRTLYAGIPRVREVTDQYMLSNSEKELKTLNQSYYQHYLQSIRSTISEEYSDSSLGVNISTQCVKKQYKKLAQSIHADFLPLTPMQLFNIVIDPRDAYIEGVVSRSSFSNTINIKNNNDEAIRVYFRPQRLHSFHFPNGDNIIVGPKSTESKTYLFYTEASGRRTHIIDIIVNENHIFSASLTVKVSPAVLELSTTDITFEPNDPPYKYLEISNKLNAPIDYVWDFIGDFIIDPLEGSVEPGRAITCTIYYEVGRCMANNYELQIRMDNKRLKMIRVRIIKLNFELEFSDNINFTMVGKNVSKTIKAKLQNKSIDDFTFKFDTSTLLDGITVYPKSGTLPRKGFLMITFKIQTSALGHFKCETILTYARFKWKGISISGTIIYPKVSFSCETIRFRKMAASSFDIKCFSIDNISKVKVAVNFDVERYPEIHFSEYYNSNFLEESNFFYINPGMQKVFSVHLYPLYPMATSFHLPIKVNGEEYSTDRSCPTIKIYMSTLNHRILIDTWQYNFTYFPHYNYKSHTEQRIVMKVKDYTKICIRLDELKEPFSFKHIRGGNVSTHQYSIVFELDADEEIVFNITFEPQSPGQYLIKLPVYVREDLSDDMHNYLCLKGYFPAPSMDFDADIIYIGFIPRNHQITKNVIVTMKNHNPDCFVETFVDDFHVSIEMASPVMEKHCKFSAKILFSSPDVHVVNTDIKFICSCGLSVKLGCIGGAENCILTIYSYIMYFEIMYGLSAEHILACRVEQVDSKSSLGASVVDAHIKPVRVPPFETSFPLFPSADDAYTQYMKTLVVSIEKWLYEQIFHTKIYYKIPDSISVYEVITETGKKPAFTFTYCNIPFYNILKYYCGAKINTIVNIEYDKDTFSVSWIYEIYENMIEFLKQVGGMLPHVQPEYLLDYDSYESYMITQNKLETIIHRSHFYLISKQCWLDLLLQTFKALEYQRIFTYASAKSNCNLRKSIMSSIQVGLDRYRSRIDSNIYSCECGILIAWLDKTFSDQKQKLASSMFSVCGSYEDIKDRSIQNFSSDLTDCLAFCAVTIKYCPYVSQHLQGIYVPPATRDETLHNACLLLKVWKMLDISFTLTPTDLVEKNPVLMQFFVSYLYEFLAHMMPTDTIFFSADLGGKYSDIIVVGNTNDVSIKFNVKLFNNQDETFFTNSSVTISPGNSTHIKVTYHAKFLRKNTVTLVLNGELYSAKFFTNSKVYTLIGQPTLGKPIQEIAISSIIYNQKEVEVEVKSPFRICATYELFCTTEEPTTLNNLKLFPYSLFYKTNTLARAYLKNYLFISSAEGIIKVYGTICTITNSQLKYWLFFKSSIGDFFVTLLCTAVPNTKDIVPLYIDLAADVVSKVCTCRHLQPDIENITCPKNIKISIPALNKTLWRTVISLYIKDVDEKEKQFWLEHQDTDVGPFLLKRILENREQYVTTNMSYIFKENITYTISGDKQEFSHAVKMSLNTSFRSVDTIIHLNSNSDKFILTLISEDLYETRRYQINLLVH